MSNVLGSGLIDHSIASLSGASQTAVGFDRGRTYLLVHNPGANDVWVRVDSAANADGTPKTPPAAAAAAAGSIRLIPGATITWENTFVPSGSVRVIGTAAQPVTVQTGA